MSKKTSPLFLASGSPRRQELLQHANIPFTIIPNLLEDETLDIHYSLEDALKALVIEKATASKAAYSGRILTADTSVIVEGSATTFPSPLPKSIHKHHTCYVLGKPQHHHEAETMLHSLSNMTHYVLTAICLYDTSGTQPITHIERTNITFHDISDSEIHTYITEKQPLDKAGSYGIQDIPKHWIKAVDGSWSNVMGLPMEALQSIL